MKIILCLLGMLNIDVRRPKDQKNWREKGLLGMLNIDVRRLLEKEHFSINCLLGMLNIDVRRQKSRWFCYFK
mgnify:CR=1 FL=1